LFVLLQVRHSVMAGPPQVAQEPSHYVQIRPSSKYPGGQVLTHELDKWKRYEDKQESH
jgi:hypothetical protein